MKASFPRSLSFYQPQYTLLHHYFSASAPYPVLEQKGTPKNTDYSSHTCNIALQLTFGGMWRWRRVAVARVFALVMRCSVMRLLLYSRVGKNRDTRRESPARAGAGRTADHLAFLFSQKILAVRSANCIYRPVSWRNYFDFIGLRASSRNIKSTNSKCE